VTDTGRKAALALASIVITLIVAEVGLRLAGWGTVTPAMGFGVNTRSALEQGRFLPDDTLFWKLPRTVNEVDRAIRAVHPDLPVPARRAPRRILVLGDSCSRISLGVLPYSALLEQELGPDRVEVLNASVPGYTTHQGLAWLNSQLLDLEPDLVVVYFGWNDHWRATGLTDRQYAASRRASRLRLLSLLRRRPDTPPLRVPLDAYRENLAAIVDACRARGARVLLIAAPHRITGEAVRRLEQTRYILAGEDPVALHREYLGVVRGMAAPPAVSVLEAARLFPRLPLDDPLLMRDGIHLTDGAHAALARALAAMITEGTGADGSVPQALVDAAASPSPSP
jgi:lysophospholipase L1-like esterase